MLVFTFLSSGATVRAEVVRFVVAGDSRGASSGINSTILSEIAQATINENADFILFPGDLVTGSSDAGVLMSQLLEWRGVMQPVYDAGIEVYPCRGNHDAGVRWVWDSVFTGEYALPDNGPPGEEFITYAVGQGNMLIVALDQYISINRVNQVWLDSVFAANDRPHVFVFGHAPAFKVRHYDCLDDYPAERDTFWNSLAAEGARAYLCGHDHFYDHARLDDGDGDPDDDLHQYIVGTAGAPLRSDGLYDGVNSLWTPTRVHHEMQFGYVLVEVVGEAVTLTWKHRVTPGVYEATDDVFSYLVVPPCCVVRGDVNNSGGLPDMSDLYFLVEYMFNGGPPPPCSEQANVNGDGLRFPNIADLVYLVDYMFTDGSAPPACQ